MDFFELYFIVRLVNACSQFTHYGAEKDLEALKKYPDLAAQKGWCGSGCFREGSGEVTS
ncbi:hypothetical protein MCT08_18480 [Vibrio aestuarianus]|uniref:hypothetical protein n=1 Tax=Vibrio aestuarianus TaxID=28171 RepID=UPI00237C6854|nr:hypothetical protein [Vibrio aestuarianus]MDE1251552.1 hypothetical protein [Vibrio aestuarianus]